MSNPYSDAEYARRVKAIEEHEMYRRMLDNVKDMFELLNEISRDPLMTCDQWGRVMELILKIEGEKS